MRIEQCKRSTPRAIRHALAVSCLLACLNGVALAQATADRVPPGPLNDPSNAAGVEAGTQGIRVLLAPALETTLVSPIAGQLSTVDASLGGRFAKNKVLVRLDCSEQNARLQMANAELASARENHEAKLRLQGLQQAGEVEVSMAASAVARAKAQVNLNSVQVKQCAVLAPFSGRVVKLLVKPHQGVTQAQPLLEIVSDGPLKLRLNAPARWVSWLKIGTPFEVDIDETAKRYPAVVSALNARIDAVSQTIELEATVTGAAEELLPGMSGTAYFSQPD